MFRYLWHMLLKALNIQVDEPLYDRALDGSSKPKGPPEVGPEKEIVPPPREPEPEPPPLTPAPPPSIAMVVMLFLLLAFFATVVFAPKKGVQPPPAIRR